VLVPIDQAQDGTGTPLDPDRFVADLADALTTVAADPARAEAMGQAGRERAAAHFSWEAIGQRTQAVYASVLGYAGVDMNEVLRLEDVTVVRCDVAILEGIARDVHGVHRWGVLGTTVDVKP